MLIELSIEQERRVFQLAAAQTQAEVDALCEPTGYDLVISVAGSIGDFVAMRMGNTRIELGEAKVTLRFETAA